MRVLVTGFEPFGGETENSSWAVAERVAAYGVGGVEIVAERLPVTFDGASSALCDAICRHMPNLIIMLGQSASIDFLKLERFAHNLMDSQAGDNAGYRPDEVPIDARGEMALRTTVNVKRLAALLLQRGYASKVSNSAGLYVCNRVYYEALRMCKERGAMQAIFIHLPLYDGQSSSQTDKKTMPLGDMCRAVQTIIEEIK